MRLADHAHDPPVAVHVEEQEVLERPHRAVHLGREGGERAAEGAHILDRGDAALFGPAAGLADQILDHQADQVAHRFVREAAALHARPAFLDLAEGLAHHRQRHEVVDGEEAGPQAVVDVVIVVGDVVAERGDLRLRAGIGGEFEGMDGVVAGDRFRQRIIGEPGQQRAVVLGDAFQRLPGEVEAVEGRIAGLQLGHQADRVGVMVEAAIGLHAFGERVLAGMAEAGVAEVVGKGQRLGQILVEAKDARDRAGDLGDFERMGEPRPVVIALVIDEDLGLVFQPPERPAMDDAVAVALKRRAGAAFGLGMEAAARGGGLGRPGGEPVRGVEGGDRRPRHGGWLPFEIRKSKPHTIQVRLRRDEGRPPQ